MAKYDAAVLTVEGLGEVRFGKNDKVVAVPLGAPEAPEGFAFVTRGGRVEKFWMAAYPEPILHLLAWHGAKQKLKDSHAAIEDPDECLDASLRVHEQLMAGTWAAQGGGGGDLSLAQAVAEVTGVEVAVAREALKGMKPAEREALRQHQPIKAWLDARAAERARGVDVEGLLGKLTG